MYFFLFLLIIGGFSLGFYYMGKILREVRSMKVDQIEILQRLEYLKRKLQRMEESDGASGMPPSVPPEPTVKIPRPTTVEPPPIPTSSVDVGSDTPPPVGAPPPYEVSGSDSWQKPKPKIVEDAADILKRMWSWILVGEEFRKPGVSAEIAIASTWLLRLFVLSLGGFVASFIALSVKNDMLPPEARVALVFLGGAALIFGGFKLLGRRYNMIGQGLMGGGILVLYLGAFAAGPHYELFAERSNAISFAMMVGVATVSAVIAVRTDSLLSAVLGIAGAFGAPLLLTTADANFTGLFGYLLILNLAVVSIVIKKEWRLLNYMAFILTYILFALSLDQYGDKDFRIVMIFLGLFFVVHSSLVFLRNLVDEQESTVLEVIHMTANALLFAFFAFNLINDRLGRPYPAVMTSLLATFYAVHAYIFLKKSLVDRRLMITFSALACLFFALTLPVIWDKASLTVGFSLLALMFLWVGRKIESNFIQSMGSFLYAVVFMRLIWGLGTGFLGDPSRKMDFSQYSAMMLERLWKYGVSVASFIGACILQKSHIGVEHEFAVTQENDMPEVVKRHAASDIFYWTGVLTGFMFLLLELNAALSYYKPMRQTMLTGLWALMGVYFLWSYIAFRKRDAFSVSAMNAFALVALIKLILLDLAGWRLNYRWIYGSTYEPFDVGMRTVDFAVVMLMFVVIWRMMRTRKSWMPAPVYGYGATFLLWIYATLELNSLLYFKLRAFQYGGISVLWALFAVVFVGVGIWKNLKLLRYSGLLLFALVAIKVPLMDLASMEVFQRMLALLVICLALLGGSFAYLHSGGKGSKR